MAHSPHHVDSLKKYPAELTDYYVIKDTIGSGGFAKVKVARHKMTGEKVAIKVMDKAKLRETDDLERVALEIAALKKLHHQNICRLYQTVETTEKHFLVLEFAPGGELFDYIVARDRLKEDEARRFFRQIICAVAFCHDQGVIHRDLKPENLLLCHNSTIKLIDFGLIAMPKDVKTQMLTTCCGSAAYAAPELIRGEPYLGEPADMWSLGILLYALLCGFLPFDDENTQKLYRLIQRGQYEIPPWLSSGSQKIISQLLKHKPEHRITMDRLLEHPWILKGLKVDRLDSSSVYPAGEEELDDVVIAEMAKYYNVSKLAMEHLIREWHFDHITSEYFLLQLRVSKGHHIRLPAKKGKLSLQAEEKLRAHPVHNTIKPLISVDGTEGASGRSSPALSAYSDASTATDPHLSVLRNEFLHIPGSMEHIPGPTGHSPPAPAAIPRRGTYTAGGSPRQNGLVPLGQQGATAFSASEYDVSRAGANSQMVRHSSNPALSPTKPRGPALTAPASEAPRMKKGSFTSLARSVMSVFGSRHNISEPRKVKGVFNVSTTSSKPPGEVLGEVLRVLAESGAEIKEKGFVVKAKMPETLVPSPRLGQPDRHIRVTLTIEVCRLARMDLVGLKLSRVKGDTFVYKKVCHDLLQQMQL